MNPTPPWDSTGLLQEIIELRREIGDLRELIARVTERLPLPPAGKAIGGRGSVEFSLDAALSLDDVEASYIDHVLANAGGNKTLAAAILGIDASTLYRKLARSS